MAYNQTPTTENNNGLYFIVGGLVVLALVIGAFVFNMNRADNNAYEPAAGYETSAPSTTDTPAATDTAPTTPAPSPTDNPAPLAP